MQPHDQLWVLWLVRHIRRAALCLQTIRSSDWRIVKRARRKRQIILIGRAKSCANQKTHPRPTRSHGESGARQSEDRIVCKHSAALRVCLANQSTQSWSRGCMVNKRVVRRASFDVLLVRAPAELISNHSSCHVNYLLKLWQWHIRFQFLSLHYLPMFNILA